MQYETMTCRQCLDTCYPNNSSCGKLQDLWTEREFSDYLSTNLMLGLECWAANLEAWGSNPGQGRNLVQDFCSTCAP